MLGLQPLRRLLPEMIDGTTTTAPLKADAAAAIGLLPGTPVVLGYIDVVCTALGAGLHDPGVEAGCTILGSTGAHMRLASSPDEVVLNEEATGYTMAMPLPGHYAQVQTHMAASLNVDWVLGMACEVLASQGVDRNRDDLIPQIDRWISASRPCELVFQPFISEAGERGPFFDRHARAGLFGMSTRHGFADVVRAVFEGLAFAARDCYGALGSTPREIRLTGGATRNASLRSMLAAATGASVRTVLREETGAAGAAMIAAVATGVYPTMDACVKDWVHPKLGELQAPDNVLAESYRKIWPAYAEARPAMRPVWRAMAEARLVDQ
jgi:erythritol kinase